MRTPEDIFRFVPDDIELVADILDVIIFAPV
jgi:hypothetical protein